MIIYTNKEGFLTSKNLRNACDSLNIEITDPEIEYIIREVNDDKGDTRITYSEFMAACSESTKKLSRDKLWAIFKQFDIDDADTINFEDITKAMRKWEQDCDAEEIQQMIMIHDKDKDSQINFEEFI